MLYPSLFACTFVWFSCGPKAEPVAEKPKFEILEKGRWLIGRWGNSSPEGQTTETWTVKDDSTFAGQTYFIAGADTLFSESITMEQRGKDLFYVTAVKDQNDGKAVSFKLTSATEKTLVFENPQHDSPKKIAYTQTGPDSLVAEISGMTEGKASEQFIMGRLK